MAIFGQLQQTRQPSAYPGAVSGKKTPSSSTLISFAMLPLTKKAVGWCPYAETKRFAFGTKAAESCIIHSVGILKRLPASFY
ncbi:WD domain containing protein [Alternaria alternata]|nr:WD domain containing protein [Alternaria alternata]